MKPSVTAILLYLLLDVLIFRTGYYSQFLKPASCAGMFQARKIDSSFQQTHVKLPTVAFLGDSRVCEGFSAREFDQSEFNHSSLAAINLAMPGSSLRVWNYLLDHVDLSRQNYRAIVIPLQSYSLTTMEEDPINRPLDLNFLLPHATTPEILAVAASYQNPELILKCTLCSLVRSWGVEEDLSDFALHPQRRLREIRQIHRVSGIADYAYPGKKQSLSGVRYDRTSLISLPSDLDSDVAARIKKKFAAKNQKVNAQQKNYCQSWLHKIIDKYSSTDTTIYLVKVPNDAFNPSTEDEVVCPELAAIGKLHNVKILPGELFRDLNAPRYFSDDLHLNSDGRELFSKTLAKIIIADVKSSSRTAL